MPISRKAATTSAEVRPAAALDDLPLYLPRLFYSFLGVVERKLVEHGLHEHLQPGMGHVLLHLYGRDNCIIKDIGQSVRVAHGTLTGLLRRMEKGGLIETRRCDHDGRAVRVALTPLGHSLEDRVRAFHDDVIDIVEHDLSAGDVRIARQLMSKMLNSLRAAEESLRDSQSNNVRTRKTHGKTSKIP